MSKQNIIRGLDMLIKVDGEVLGGQRSCDIEMSTDTIDVTSKSNYGWSDAITGVKSWTVSTDGVLFIDDDAMRRTEQAFLNSEEIEVEFYNNRSKELVYYGNCIPTSISISASYDDITTYSVSLQGNGALGFGEKSEQDVLVK